MPSVLPRPRWALTPPFHPCLIRPCSLKSETLPSCGVKVGAAIGGIFLLHCLSPHGARPLAGILLYGARTFLDTLPCRGCLADFRSGL